MDKKDKQLTRDPRLHDATTPSVAASLEASAQALEESTFPRRPSELAPLIEILEEQVSDSGYLDAVSKLATAYLVVGRPQDAHSLFERCVKENPDFIEAWANLAFTRLQLDLSDEAGVIFPLILKNRASNADLHNLYGHFLALQGLYREAIVEYERALTLSPQSYLAHNNIALAYEALGQREKVLEHFSEAVSLEPLYKGLGIIKDDEIHPEALERFRTRVQGNPLRANAFYEAAFFYSAQDESDKALRMLGDALVLEPDFARYYTALGFLEMNWEDRESAVEHFQSSLAIDSGAYEAHIHLGFYFGEEEKMDLVLEHFEKAVELRPYYPDLHFNLGEVLLNEGRFEEAIASFRHALTMNPYYGMALFKLGYAHEEAGQLELAAEAFSRLKSIDPEFPDIDEFIDELSKLATPTVLKRKEGKGQREHQSSE